MELPNHFDKLPNEIVLKIIKMAVSSRNISFRTVETPSKVNAPSTYHTDLVNWIAKISSRFQSIATTKSLWNGNVEVWAWDGDHQAIVKKVIHEFLSKGTKDLNITVLCDFVISLVNIPEDDFLLVPEKCPELETLVLGLPMRIWPRFGAPWLSLRELTTCIPHHTHRETSPL